MIGKFELPLPGRQSAKSGSEPEQAPQQTSAQASKASLRLLLSITNEEAERHVAELFHAHGAPLLCEIRARGTAPTEFLDILGLGDNTRILTVGYVTRSRVREIFDGMNRALAYGRRGTGIAVSLPLNAAQGALVQLLTTGRTDPAGNAQPPANAANKTGAHAMTKDMNLNPTSNPSETAGASAAGASAAAGFSASAGAPRYHLLWVSVASGHSDDVVNAAREVGARGGTVLHGRRIGEDTVSYLGFDGQEEQDFVMIIIPADKKAAVMQAIVESCGLNTPAKGVVVSLPVEDAVGLV